MRFKASHAAKSEPSDGLAALQQQHTGRVKAGVDHATLQLTSEVFVTANARSPACLEKVQMRHNCVFRVTGKEEATLFFDCICSKSLINMHAPFS